MKDLIISNEIEARYNLIKSILKLPSFSNPIYKLYENVMIQNLQCDEKEYSDKDVSISSKKILDIVVCKGDSVKLYLQFENGDKKEKQKPLIEGIFSFRLGASEIYDDIFEQLLGFIEDVLKIKSIVKYTLLTVPFESRNKEEELHRLFIREHLIEKQAPLDLITNYGQVLITDYGQENGLITECKLNNNGFLSSKVVATPKIFAELRAIEKLRKAKQTNLEKRIPLAERIQNMEMGMFSNHNNAVSLVEKSASLPIEIFFRKEPNLLNELKKLIAKFDEALQFETYIEVAFIIRHMLMDKNNKIIGRKAMLILASSILNETTIK